MYITSCCVSMHEGVTHSGNSLSRLGNTVGSEAHPSWTICTKPEQYERAADMESHSVLMSSPLASKL